MKARDVIGGLAYYQWEASELERHIKHTWLDVADIEKNCPHTEGGRCPDFTSTFVEFEDICFGFGLMCPRFRTEFEGVIVINGFAVRMSYDDGTWTSKEWVPCAEYTGPLKRVVDFFP